MLPSDDVGSASSGMMVLFEKQVHLQNVVGAFFIIIINIVNSYPAGFQNSKITYKLPLTTTTNLR